MVKANRPFRDDIPDDYSRVNSLKELKKKDPKPPEELISGILRKGHKMLISGSSKAGKSFLLMELCIALSEGREWMGFKCRKSRVLYVNMELDPASCCQRFISIYGALGINDEHIEDIGIWDMRGDSTFMPLFINALKKRIIRGRYDAVVIDPIYKLLSGDENSAKEMSDFCHYFDDVCKWTKASVILCHHHSKGYQGSKRSMDRASGSGVFARDPDALLDIIQLELTAEQKYQLKGSKDTAWRMEFTLREFPPIDPIDFWFRHPIHVVDHFGALEGAEAQGSRAANLLKGPTRTSETERDDHLDTAYDVLSLLETITVADLANYLEISDRTVRRYLKNRQNEYKCVRGVVTRIEKDKFAS